MSSEKQPAAAEGAKREADIYDLLTWLEVNRKKVGIVAAILVALAFMSVTMRYFKKQKEEKASAELLALKPTLVQPTNVVPPQASSYVKLADDYKGTSAGERARIFAATSYFAEGRYADAEKEFRQFVQESPDSPWVANAAYGVAASQESANKSDEAFASYQTVVTAHPNAPVVADAKFALARIYETRKQSDQALRLYQELTAPQPGAQPGESAHPEAAARKEALLRTHPELSTNRVASSAMTVPPLPVLNTNQSVNSANTNNTAVPQP